MAGKKEDSIPTPGEFIAESLCREGYSVISTSQINNRYLRLLDITQTLINNHRRIKLIILSVYVGKSFVVEDIVSRLARVFAIPIIMVLHNGLMPAFVSIFPTWSRTVLDRAAVIVSPSPFIPRALKPYGIRSIVIPNPIDINRYPYETRYEAQPNMLWMRSFYPYYNPELAVRVLSRLVHLYPNICLTMAGKDKGLLPEIVAMATKLGVKKNIVFPGFLNFPAKIQAFKRSDVFLNTNSVDNAPVSVTESWAMGVPVVSTLVGGLGDLIHNGETGLLVADDDDEAMARSILSLLKNPKLVEKLSHQGRAEAEAYSWDVVRHQWQTIFDEALESGRN